MEYIVIGIAAVIVSGLSLFSGFGLGTVLTPLFVIFFPIEIAVGMTALVHFSNGIFKLILMGKNADKATVLRFGIPAILSAFVGAYLLGLLSGMQPLTSYDLAGRHCTITTIKLVIAVIMSVFSVIELIPRLNNINIERKYLPIGGLLSGFFGGLSGNQGALRSTFLLHAGLDKKAFVGTGVVIACIVDITRISVYAYTILVAKKTNPIEGHIPLLIVACLSAFIGAYVGKRLLKKVTIRTVQLIVAIMMFLIAIGLGSGLI
ncbi:MAG: sulfite exporter TauE/SafE family protein [bacterium]